LFAYPGSGSDHCSIPDPGGKKAPDPQHWLKVIDFGLAVELAPGSPSVLRKLMSGTRDYMAPETLAGYVIENGVMNRAAMRDISGVRVSAKSDVWALGIILYQTVFGMLPFAAVPGGRLAKVACLTDLDLPVDFEQGSVANYLNYSGTIKKFSFFCQII
jgi:serine/threonine protein kinase